MALTFAPVARRLRYRILKLAGPFAAVYVLMVCLGLLLAFLGQPEIGRDLILGAQAVFIVMLAIAFTRVQRAWRQARLRESDEPPRHPRHRRR